MSLRLSISEAQQKKLITEAQASEMRRREKPKRNTGLRSANNSSSSSKKPMPPLSPIEGSTPQQKLWRALVQRYPDLVKSGELRWELSGVVPGRKYSLDMAFCDLKLGCELDGWEWHGKNIKNFKRDRKKDRLLLLSGWRVLRFYASEIKDDLDNVLDMIEQARTVVASEKRIGERSA